MNDSLPDGLKKTKTQWGVFYNKFSTKAKPKEHMLNEATNLEAEFVISRHVPYKDDKSFSFGYYKTVDDYIIECGDQNTHSFEIIRHHKPCKLYFDIEYMVPSNEAFVNQIIDSIKKHALSFMGVVINDCDLYISTAHGIGESASFKGGYKYSFHIVVNNGFYFENNEDIKNFISYIQSNETDVQIIDAIDDGVYTKNRDFKLPHQSKFGSIRCSEITNGVFKNHLINYYPSFETHKGFYKFNKFQARQAKSRCRAKGSTNQNYDSDIGVIYPHQLFEKSVDPNDVHELLATLKNEDLKWGTYYIVACLLKNTDQTEETFMNWAKLSSKFDKNESSGFWNSLEKREDGYNLHRLREMVKTKYPHAFRESKHIYIDSVTEPTINFEEHGYDVEMYTQRYCKPITPCIFDKKYDTIVIKSQMGTGKTTIIEEVMRQKKYKSCLIISNRVIYAYKMHADFKRADERFEFYKDVPKTKRAESSFIVCQLESLDSIAEHFDVVIMDESESIFNQFGSTTMEKALENVATKIKTIMSTAKLVICGDAFIMDRTLCLIEKLRPKTAKKLYIHNSFQPYKRIAYSVGKTSDEFCGFFSKFIKKNPKDRNVISTGSRVGSEMLNIDSLKEGITTLVVNKYSSDEVYEQMRNVNEFWSKYQNVIYTSSITVGVSYDCDLHFDNLHMFITTHGACIRDMMQSSKRARKIKNDVLYYASNSSMWGVSRPNMFTFDELKKWKTQTIPKGLEGGMGDEWLVDLWAYNNLEMNINAHFHKDLLERYLLNCGYTEGGMGDTLTENIKSKNMDAVGNDIIYEDIEELKDTECDDPEYMELVKGKTESDEVYVRIMRGEADEDDKKQYMKYKFHKEILFEWWKIDLKTRIAMFEVVLANTDGIEGKMKNIKYEINGDERVSLFVDNIEQKGLYINEMKEILGIVRTFDFSIVPRDKMNAIRAWFIENNKRTHEVWSLDTRRYSKNSVYDTDKMLSGFVSHLFSTWSGCGFSNGERKQKMIKGVRTETSDYKVCCPIPWLPFVNSAKQFAKKDKDEQDYWTSWRDKHYGLDYVFEDDS